MDYPDEVRRILVEAALENPEVVRAAVMHALKERMPMGGRFGYACLPSVYEDTDTPALKAEREMFAEIAESRSPQEYIEILRRYNRLSDLAENPVTRRMRREKAELDAEEYRQWMPVTREWRRESEVRARETVSQAKPTLVQPVAEGEWWPYDPDKPIGDGDRGYQQRFKPEKGD